VIEAEGLVRRAAEKGKAFMERLQQSVEKFEHVKAVRGRGLMMGLVLDQPAKPLVEMMSERGLLTLATAENVVRMLPPLNVKDGELEEAGDIIEEALADWHGVDAPAESDAATEA
jgi:acetylornithine/N-succinyldiaminopimelate aminotransferase